MAKPVLLDQLVQGSAAVGRQLPAEMKGRDAARPVLLDQAQEQKRMDNELQHSHALLLGLLMHVVAWSHTVWLHHEEVQHMWEWGLVHQTRCMSNIPCTPFICHDMRPSNAELGRCSYIVLSERDPLPTYIYISVKQRL
jgi:hypothetical protein